MKEDNENNRHDESRKLEFEVLHFSKGDERAYIVTNGKKVRTYTTAGCYADDELRPAIARLTCRGYSINMSEEVIVPDRTADDPRVRMKFNYW